METDDKGNLNICEDGSSVLNYIKVKVTGIECLITGIRINVMASFQFLEIFGLKIDTTIARNIIKKARKFNICQRD